MQTLFLILQYKRSHSLSIAPLYSLLTRDLELGCLKDLHATNTAAVLIHIPSASIRLTCSPVSHSHFHHKHQMVLFLSERVTKVTLVSHFPLEKRIRIWIMRLKLRESLKFVPAKQVPKPSVGPVIILFLHVYALLMKLHLCKLVKTQLCKLSSLSRPWKRSMLYVVINPFDNHESCMIFAKQLVLTLPFTSITQLFNFDMFYSKLAYNPHGYSISELLSTIWTVCSLSY